MFISNYGLFWQRKYVNFGYGGNKGTLLGKMDQNNSFPVDFREQTGIYVLYDKDFIPIYVGQAGNGNETLFSRLKHHTTDDLCNRWEYFTWFGLRRVSAKRRLAAHGSAEPKLNKQGAKIKEKTAEEYRQAVDENFVAMSIEGVAASNERLKRPQKAVGKQLKKK